MSSDEAFDFPAPPQDFISYEANRIISIFDDPSQVQRAMEDLKEAGFATDDISVLAGPEGASRLDLVGDHHGLRGRIYRFVERLGDEHVWLQRHAELLKGGAYGLAVSTAPDQKSAVAAIIAKHGGHDAAFFGKAAWEEM